MLSWHALSLLDHHVILADCFVADQVALVEAHNHRATMAVTIATKVSCATVSLGKHRRGKYFVLLRG